MLRAFPWLKFCLCCRHSASDVSVYHGPYPAELKPFFCVWDLHTELQNPLHLCDFTWVSLILTLLTFLGTRITSVCHHILDCAFLSLTFGKNLFAYNKPPVWHQDNKTQAFPIHWVRRLNLLSYYTRKLSFPQNISQSHYIMVGAALVLFCHCWHLLMFSH